MEKLLIGTEADREYTIHVHDAKLTCMVGHVPLKTAVDGEDTSLDAGRPHTHSWYELFYVVDGQLDCHMGDGSFFLSRGEMLLVPPGYPHYTVAEVGEACRYVLNFSVQAPRGGALETILSFTTYQRLLPGEETCRAMELLCRALQSGDENLAGAYLWELCVLLCRAAKPKPVENLLADENISRIYKLEMLLGRYYTSDLSMDTVAEALHLSTRQLGRLIRRQYGCTYREKRTAMRLEAAEHLLRTTDDTVTSIAGRVGYDSLKCFYAAFRGKHGCLPGQWREEERKES